jgi:hypothetical protein
MRRSKSHIARFLPILGFALRSTNTRNAFEFFVPLVDLARKALKRNAKIILSSEWNYSPFTYPFVFSELPDFVLIGLPASESDNPLIIPLAGHELGHSIWKIYDLTSLMTPNITTIILRELSANWDAFEKLFETKAKPEALETDLALRAIWYPALDWSRRQIEEIFCDLVGVRLFGESYFHATEYLLSPHFQNRRSPNYPDIQTRTETMAQAAKAFGISSPGGFSSRFTEGVPRLDAKQHHLLGIADKATAECIGDAIAAAGKIAEQATIPLPADGEAARIQECLKAGIPAQRLKNLSEIINAGWREYLRIGAGDTRVLRSQKFNRLSDLIFKTIEVMEFEIRTGTTT